MSFLDSVKDIAGAVGNTVSKGAKTVSESSKKLAEKTKIKREIALIEADINNSYMEIGKRYFEVIKSTPEEDYAFDVDNIIAKMAELEEAKKTLMQLEDKHTCPQCGASVYKEQKFCDKCGAKLEEFVKVEVVEEVTINEGADCNSECDADTEVKSSVYEETSDNTEE